MSEKKHRTTPDQSETRMPGGVPYIIGNELAERFSFYGMNAILTVFATQHLLNAAGEPDYMSSEESKGVVHLFKAGAYFFPIVGAIISDVLWGKYKTILLISLMYCLGHGMLALMDVGPHMGWWDMRPFLYAGLLLIAVGAGGIKPCVSAHVGDQFGSGNKHLITRVFNWFYFSINTGAAASSFLTPIFLAGIPFGTDPETGEAIKIGGPWLAFGVPGVLMAIATFLFWMGRHKFVHVPAAGWTQWKRETFSPAGIRALKNLSPLFLFFVAAFWAIFDQTASAWVLQAEQMDRWIGDFELLSSQLQAVNPILILCLIPVFAFIVYPAINAVFPLTPLRKIGIGLFLTCVCVVISALIEVAIAGKAPGASTALWQALNADGVEGSGNLSSAVQAARDAGWNGSQIQPFLADMPHVGWQVLAYIVLTSAEVMVSIVCLEFAYTQSPKKMKSFIMGVYFLGVSLGNIFVSGLNFGLDKFRDEDGASPLQGASYWWFFAILMGVVWLAYLFYSKTYKGETYIQGEDEDIAQAEAEAEGPDAR